MSLLLYQDIAAGKTDCYIYGLQPFTKQLECLKVESMP